MVLVMATDLVAFPQANTGLGVVTPDSPTSCAAVDFRQPFVFC